MDKSGNGSKQIEKEMIAHFGFVPDFYKTLPSSALPAEWAAHRDFELAETAIPNKYKELIGLAVAAHIKCRYCIYFHSQAAVANGATEEELKEACMMGGLTVQYSNAISGMRYDFEKFQGEVDRAVEFMTTQATVTHQPTV
ncbi:MAG TPA: carboxymuconolactone decarboxylase family protein [Polyangia bacterium]|nr:carboxymuconolactone decarboxylase family protein [Polyangia bacterium]